MSSSFDTQLPRPPQHNPPPPADDPEATVIVSALPPPPRISQTLPMSAGVNGSSLRQVGRYQIIDLLGRGGMATVYKAHDPSIDRTIAIKFLHASLCEEPQHRERFLREARAAGMLAHPNIVTVHDVGEIEGRPYMAMELLDGEPLSDVMDKGQPLPLKDALEITLQLARALDYAHAKGIVHRDIKPANIVRLRGGHAIKVTDFGIAHVAGAGGSQTRVGDVLGTPQYMSPEQTLGAAVDGRSDLFSVGIVLYQMLTGQRPFESDSIVALAVKIAREEPAPIDSQRADLPPAVRRIVERCLAKQPAKRFQTGKELADAIAKQLWQLEEEAREKSRARIVPLRVKWAAMMAAIVALVMAASASVISQRQNAALMDQVMDYGASLTRFIAAQNALAALGEEWEPVEITVQEAMKGHDFQSLVVIDRAGVVRASGDAAQVGQPYRAPAGTRLASRPGGVGVTRQTLAGQGDILGFEAPITFQGKPVGRVVLGLAEEPLVRVARLSQMLMVVLVLVTIAAVAVAMYFVANWFARPIKLLEESMAELGKGRLDHRIAETRKDEFGLVYQAFDQMAAALQARFAPDEPAAAGSGPVATPAAPSDGGPPPLARTQPLTPPGDSAST
ncbi:MAG TPA: protein kinase [Burkholderiaceae bacterium]|nr:protein kinase [Burkholderiaceae bacterium]